VDSVFDPAGYPDILAGVAKVLVSLDDRLLKRVDMAARSRGLTRSRYLASLAERDFGASAGPGARLEARRAIERLDELFRAHKPAGDSTAAIRADREAR
jgi:hypothetical protein